ncbi:kinase [Stenotrophomonas sp. S48]|uniref:kinase n=1 Tax=unclassified Stenotrophomonas TaxID=196198 RepID=UPI001901D7DB|nr:MULTISPECIES: kinase [unclassified Stenotrophomonas]MBK0026204.1 kinase [Stenotrophomonas sp. S48]MBK0048126.1 kinase [Stenotrophomonas sp. S49]
MVAAAYMPVVKGFPETLAEQALDDALASTATVPVLAISGVQGSGKSTLAAQVVARARSRGLNAAALSIDDVYLTRAQRQRLARQVHPLLITRGPPGTHDLPLAHAVLDAVAARQPLALPRFDKLADERLPEAQWSALDAPLDLLVFEGWFLGTPAQTEAELDRPLNALEQEADPDGRWRRWCNQALADHYPALWQRCDRLWFLQPPDFAVVPRWRWQQEQNLQAAQPGRHGMTRPQLERFVQYYERVSRQALRALPALADHVVQLDGQRQVQAVR